MLRFVDCETTLTPAGFHADTKRISSHPMLVCVLSKSRGLLFRPLRAISPFAAISSFVSAATRIDRRCHYELTF